MTVADTPALVFIGAPGSGKSRIGKRVAKLLGLPFVDTDKRIVARHGPIPGIFESHGEPHFRAIEREQVRQALTEPGVISLGGGAVLDVDTQAELEPLRVVQLTVSADAIVGRNLSNRPLLTGVDSWKALVAERAPLYDALADVTFDTTSLPAERIADNIVSWLERQS